MTGGRCSEVALELKLLERDLGWSLLTGGRYNVGGLSFITFRPIVVRQIVVRRIVGEPKTNVTLLYQFVIRIKKTYTNDHVDSR